MCFLEAVMKGQFVQNPAKTYQVRTILWWSKSSFLWSMGKSTNFIAIKQASQLNNPGSPQALNEQWGKFSSDCNIWDEISVSDKSWGQESQKKGQPEMPLSCAWRRCGGLETCRKLWLEGGGQRKTVKRGGKDLPWRSKEANTAESTSLKGLMPRVTWPNLQRKTISLAAWQKMHQGQEWRQDELEDYMR